MTDNTTGKVIGREGSQLGEPIRGAFTDDAGDWQDLTPEDAHALWQALDDGASTFANARIRLQRGKRIIMVDVSRGFTMTADDIRNP